MVTDGVISGDVESGVRKRITINGENFYLFVSQNEVFCTVPRENDVNMTEVRRIVEVLCAEITEIWGG